MQDGPEGCWWLRVSRQILNVSFVFVNPYLQKIVYNYIAKKLNVNIYVSILEWMMVFRMDDGFVDDNDHLLPC